jgi:bifunctional DNase/RNase
MEQLKSAREVRVHSLQATEDGGVVVLLEEVKGSRLVPIYAGLPEGKAIAVKVNGFETPRPMTHDLIAAVVEKLGATVSRIDIHDIQDSVFLARITLTTSGGVEVFVDARPSDAINVALRANVPIFVAGEVFSKTELVLKPIEEDEVARFKQELETADPLEALKALEGQKAPQEPGAE